MTPAKEAAAIDAYDVEWTDLLLFGGKVCAVCGVEKPRCKTYFTPSIQGNEDGLHAQCKSCRAAADRERYKNDPAFVERKRERMRRYDRARKVVKA